MKNFIKKFAVAALLLAFIIGGTAAPVHATTQIEAIVAGSEVSGTGTVFRVGIYDNTYNQFDTFFAFLDLGTDLVHGVTTSQLFDAVKTKTQAYATNMSYSLATNDFYWPNLNPDEFNTIQVATQPASFNNTPSHSIVTTAAAANGWQISSTRNASVFYSVNVNTTATIAGNADGYIVLEVAATNSTTASDWKEVSRTRNGQALSLALTLQSIQNIGGELMNIVPAGYYTRLRSVNVSGTPTYSYVSGQEVTL